MGHDHVASQLHGYATVRSTSASTAAGSEDEVLWVSSPHFLSYLPWVGRSVDAEKLFGRFGAVTEEFEVRDAIAGVLCNPSIMIGASA
jgi:hypothetical protein